LSYTTRSILIYIDGGKLMKFLNWLFDRGRKTESFQGSENEFLPDPKKFVPVPKWTHAGRAGKTVHCPKCSGKTHVYSFGWHALKCGACKAMVDKSEWLMPVPEDEK
jgi:hypothetical protein